MRGDVYTLRAPKDARGHEQTGGRYAFRPEVEINGTTTRVLAEQLTVIDPQLRLGELAGRLTTGELQELDVALQVVLGLDE